jgi:hypothetical protein
VIEFEEKMAALGAGLSEESRTLTRQVLDLELRNRFGDRTQLPEEFAARALKIVKARPQVGDVE